MKMYFREKILKDAIKKLAENQQIIFFDTETTGLSPETDKVIQLSATKCEIDNGLIGSEIETLEIYINPEMQLPKIITQITGITDKMLEDAPTETEVFHKINAFFGKNTLVCGHNVSFDCRMLESMYKRNNNQFIVNSIDTLAIARELLPKPSVVSSHKLGVLVEYYGLNDGLTFHNAIDDVIATQRLLKALLDEYENRCEEIAKQQEIHKEQHLRKVKVKSCWTWTGYRGMQRLYVRTDYEDKMLWLDQVHRPYRWGEKEKGTMIGIIDIDDVEKQVLKLYHCNSVDELAKVRHSVTAR